MIVALKGCYTFSITDCPYFQQVVARCWYYELFTWCELYVPNAFLMSTECCFKRQRRCLPYLDCLVLRGSRDQLVVGWNSHGIDVFLMCHDCHFGRCNRLKFIYVRDFPNLESVVLADWGEELTLPRCEADTWYGFIMTLVDRLADHLLLECIFRVVLPQPYLIVLCSSQEEWFIWTYVEANYYIGVTLVKLSLAVTKIQQL